MCSKLYSTWNAQTARTVLNFGTPTLRQILLNPCGQVDSPSPLCLLVASRRKACLFADLVKRALQHYAAFAGLEPVMGLNPTFSSIRRCEPS